MSKRRVFDIDFPDEPAVPAGTEKADAEDAVASPEHRRGPMAKAISENAEALRARAEVEQTIRAENDRLAHEFVRLKKLGLVVDRIPLDQIKVTKLTRDRSAKIDPELAELKESIRTIGLSNPIRVEEDGDGYQLVQGFRRMSAYRELLQETGDEEFAAIPAGLVARGETLQGLYRRMVDENLVRRDISFAEMAQLAVSYCEDPETEAPDLDAAVATLYASAGRQKRVYIRNFAELLDLLGAELRFPEAISRNLGLDLRRALLADEAACAELRSRLRVAAAETHDDELEVLKTWLAGRGQGAGRTASSEQTTDGAAKAAPGGQAKTTLRCTVPAGTVRCQARNGRIEMAMERDFSGVDQRKLEAAIHAFFAELEE
ncbi:ParB/RepB/Spo0J family partition protein [Epibacterium sp. Ofav1-8]|uniref:ParB/RepB/Spo0J family partition protein n=1 Tax=Epibacterium sp. Ofav1-8 TaxID=2917735 RepID=UPI001EF56B85|nr:ParB N-terminal domain-containing protein [Epibacterium sp. Ofav1-8]MCG7625394.1 ParB N-terminal domain-containing protein [Epibacterium sp. Ofav1-8]